MNDKKRLVIFAVLPLSSFLLCLMCLYIWHINACRKLIKNGKFTVGQILEINGSAAREQAFFFT
jgi:hypothetical protein